MRELANLNILKQQGLISFEEITDYSILTDAKKIEKVSKRKSAEENSNESVSKKKKTGLQEKSKEETKKVEKSENVPSKKSQRKTDKSNPASDLTNDREKEGLKKEKKKKKSKKAKLIEEKKKLKQAKKFKSNSTSRLTLKVEENGDKEYDEEEMVTKMQAWSNLMLPKSLLRALYDKGFYEPMPIQSLVVPEAIKNRSNIIGTAQTGSGKTLAFGLPILTRLIDSYEAQHQIEEANESQDEFKTKRRLNDGPQALILTPTRELAIQIKDHLQACSKYEKIKIGVVVGGISQQKQERLLSKRPEIVVATPGRLMQLINEGNEFLNNISQVKYLVLDEADRMIEKGHFTEMKKILGIANCEEKYKIKRQNFLFSATLITKFSGDFEQKEKTENQLKRELKAQLNMLVETLQMVKEPKLFDLTTKAVTADNLIESKIFCSKEEKDIYLYYFICKYGGRTLVFANSIDCVRRLSNLFRLLNKTPLSLHANMNQKQRLKNLEKFSAEKNSILIASDVASRGLDIPGVMHVIHYQIPRSAEIYVHRSGRTARSSNEGLSVMLVSPEEMNLYRKTLKTFTNKEIRDYPIDTDYYEECKKRVTLARKVDELQHQMSKEKSNVNWYEKHARMLDMELDDEIMKETHVDSNQASKNQRKLSQFKNELNQLLNKMMFPKYVSKNYLESQTYEKVMSMNKTNLDALNELKNKKKTQRIKNFKPNSKKNKTN